MSIWSGRERNVWRRFDLLEESSVLRRRSDHGLGDDQDRAAKLRQAFEELGGLYAAFAIFLSSRFDLLPTEYLTQLQTIPQPQLSQPSKESLSSVFGRFPAASQVGHSLYSSVLAIQYGEIPAFVEVFAPVDGTLEGKRWRAFSRGVHLLRNSPVGTIARPRVIREFQYWLQLHCDVRRKRQMLGTLRTLPEESRCRFPRLIGELQTDRILAYEALEGESLSEIWDRGLDCPDEAKLHVDGIVEQLLFLSTVAAQLRPEDLVVTEEARLGYRVCPAMNSVPPSHHQNMLRYVASTVAGDDNQACRMFVQICRAQGSALTEPALWRELGGLGIETDGALPESLERMRDFWRASSRQDAYLPFFFQTFHQNLLLLGQQEKEHYQNDFIPQSIWSVLSRLIQFHSSDLLGWERGQEWVLGGGLLPLATTRQFTSLLQRFRDNELAIQIRSDDSNEKPERRWGRLTGGILLVALFLLLSQLSFQLTDSFLKSAAGFLAAGCGLGLMLLILRMR